jgi:hypothetical protein
VRLDAPEPVAAPYPFLILTPKSIVSGGERYIVIHGFVSESGRFQELRVIRHGLPETDEILLSCLKAWEFRPASRDGQAVQVEVLLAVPSSL